MNFRPGTAKNSKKTLEFPDLYKLATFKPGVKDHSIKSYKVACVPKFKRNHN